MSENLKEGWKNENKVAIVTGRDILHYFAARKGSWGTLCGHDFAPIFKIHQEDQPTDLSQPNICPECKKRVKRHLNTRARQAVQQAERMEHFNKGKKVNDG